MIVRLLSGSLEGKDAVSEDGTTLDKPAMLVYAGKFKSMDGDVEIKDDDIDKLAGNHNSFLSKLSRLATGDVPLKHSPPIQLDHSTSARDTVGRLVGPLTVGDHSLEDGSKVKALLGTVRFLGKENVEKVRDGRWSHLSIGADLELHKISELTVTPFPAAADASLLSRVRMSKSKYKDCELEVYQNEAGQWIWSACDSAGIEKTQSSATEAGKKAIDEFIKKHPNLSAALESLKDLANPGKVDEPLWEKAKAASQVAFGAHRWPYVRLAYEESGGKYQSEASMSFKEAKEKMSTYEKCKKHLMDKEKLSEEDADKKLEAMDDESTKKMAAEHDDSEKKHKDEELKRMGALKDEKAKLIKFSKDMRSIQTNVNLAKKKSDIRLRLNNLKAAQKLTPAEMKSIKIDDLAAKSDEAIQAALSSYEKRQPVIDTGLFGSTKALTAGQMENRLQKLRMERAELESRLNMPSKREDALKRMTELEVQEKDAQVHIDNTPQGQQTDGDYEKFWGAHKQLMVDGKHDEAKEHLKKYLASMGGQGEQGMPVSDPTPEMSALADEVKKMQTGFDEIVKLAAPVFGVTAEELV